MGVPAANGYIRNGINMFLRCLHEHIQNALFYRSEISSMASRRYIRMSTAPRSLRAPLYAAFPRVSIRSVSIFQYSCGYLPVPRDSTALFDIFQDPWSPRWSFSFFFRNDSGLCKHFGMCNPEYLVYKALGWSMEALMVHPSKKRLSSRSVLPHSFMIVLLHSFVFHHDPHESSAAANRLINPSASFDRTHHLLQRSQTLHYTE